MSDGLEQRVSKLETQFAGAEARSQERHKREVRMEEKIDRLLEDNNQRRGREDAQRKESDHQHDDRWQVWMRALFPVAIITAIFQALLAWFKLGGPTE